MIKYLPILLLLELLVLHEHEKYVIEYTIK